MFCIPLLDSQCSFGIQIQVHGSSHNARIGFLLKSKKGQLNFTEPLGMLDDGKLVPRKVVDKI